jgi:hypothetical protein
MCFNFISVAATNLQQIFLWNRLIVGEVCRRILYNSSTDKRSSIKIPVFVIDGKYNTNSLIGLFEEEGVMDLGWNKNSNVISNESRKPGDLSLRQTYRSKANFFFKLFSYESFFIVWSHISSPLSVYLLKNIVAPFIFHFIV